MGLRRKGHHSVIRLRRQTPTTLVHDSAGSVFDELQRAIPDAFEDRETDSLLPNKAGNDQGIAGTGIPIIPEPAATPIQSIEELRPSPQLSGDILDPASEALPGGSEGRLREEIQRGGIESLAWYRPRHFYPQTWGIYLRESGVLFVAKQVDAWIKGNSWTPPRSGAHVSVWAIWSAAYFLYRHENFHFLTELFASKAEAVLGQPRYISYCDGVFATGLATGTCHEEHLATFEGCANKKIIEAKLVDAFQPVIHMSPPAYRNAAANIWPRLSPPRAEWQQLAADIVRPKAESAPPLAFVYPLAGRWGVEHYSHIPTFLYCDLGGTLLNYLPRYKPSKSRQKAARGP